MRMWKLNYKSMEVDQLVKELGSIKRSHDQNKMIKLKFILDEILIKV